MKTVDEEAAKMVQKIRLDCYFLFLPVAICSVAAAGFAVFHHVLYTVAFVFSAVVYLPVATGQYRRTRQISEKIIKNYQQWLNEQKP